MANITDESMKQLLSQSKTYSFVLLKAGPNVDIEGVRQIIWEHGRRNFSLRAEKLLAIVGPLTDDCEIAGIGIFDAGIEETKQIMEGDPAVKAGVFVYEIHPMRSFPGDSLP